MNIFDKIKNAQHGNVYIGHHSHPLTGIGTVAELQGVVAENERFRTALRAITATGKVSHSPAKSWDVIGELEREGNRLISIAHKALADQPTTEDNNDN